MIAARVHAMLQSLATNSPLLPPTYLYNEGWLLRLLLDWYEAHTDKVPDNHPLVFPSEARWFSEARLPSAFLPRWQGDDKGESWTHVDGAIGHFVVGKARKTDLTLVPDARHFVVLEAKLFSRLSQSTANARYYDQAARNVACIAEVLRHANRQPSSLRLGFYVLAPESQIRKGIFKKEMDPDGIRLKIAQRVDEWGGPDKKQWYVDWVVPTIEAATIATVSWEEVIETIVKYDLEAGSALGDFYDQCRQFALPPSAPLNIVGIEE